MSWYVVVLRVMVLSGFLAASACTSMQPRPAESTLGCIHAVRAQLPEHLVDKQQHCRLSALIARQCSVSEAYLAGMAKELRDLFGPGDAEWADWRADRAGMRCARSDDATIDACCEQQGY